MSSDNDQESNQLAANTSYFEQVPTYNIRPRAASTERRLELRVRKPQVIRATMDQQEDHDQQTVEYGLEASHNDSSLAQENQDEMHNDSLEGNGADDEGDEAMSRDEDGMQKDSGDASVSDRTVATRDLSEQAGFQIKPDGKSNKYPLLKVYYEFGPWVGRNRKAICVRCKHTSASSQPERLIRHLRRCAALTDEDRQVAEELLMVSNANKKKNKTLPRNILDSEDTDYYADDDNNKSTDTSKMIALPAGVKRVRRDHPDRKKHVDHTLVRFIICHRIPLKSIHSKEFLDFIRSLDPDYRLPTRDTITNTLIPGLLNI